MCNYLKKYTTLNDAHYIRYTSLWKMYNKCIPYLSGIFSEQFFFLNLLPKRGTKLACPPLIFFKSREGNCPQVFLQTHMEHLKFMSVRILSCLCLSIFSFLGIRNFLSAIKYLSFSHVISVYWYHILLFKVMYWPFKTI